MKKAQNIVLNDSFTEFLMYTIPDSKVKVEIFLHDENIWLMQEKIASLFGVDRSVVTKHLKNIFQTNELQEDSVCAKIAHTAAESEKYQTIQDRLLESDFDKHVAKFLENKNGSQS